MACFEEGKAEYSNKEPFEVYNVISVKDALAILQRYASNSNFNTQDAEDFFINEGATVWGLCAPAHRLADKVNEKNVAPVAREMAKETRSPGRS